MLRPVYGLIETIEDDQADASQPKSQSLRIIKLYTDTAKTQELELTSEAVSAPSFIKDFESALE